MRTRIPFLLTATIALSAPFALSQDEDSTDPTEAAREILEDPRLNGLLQSAREDPGGTAEDIESDPDAAVREATRIFQEAQKKLDTPENRARARALASEAISEVEEMTESDQPAAEPAATDSAGEAPVVSRPLAEPVAATGEPAAETEGAPAATDQPAQPVPATRSASTTTEVATPVAMPVGEDAAPLASDTPPAPIRQSKQVAPLLNVGPTEPRIPDSPLLTQADVPDPKPLQPRFNTRKPSTTAKSGKDFMEIRSRESVFDSKRGVLTFTGGVYVDHPDYDLNCEKLEIELTGPVGEGGSSAGQTIKRATATGGMIKIERIGEDGNIQVAFARKADYDAIKQEFILSGGPPSIQDGQRSVKTDSQDSQIIMRGNGTYEIIGSDAGSKGRNTIKIPVPKASGDADAGLGGSLGGSIDQLR